MVAAGSVAISVSTTTLRYWKNKLLPILLVAVDCDQGKVYFTWFDKSLVVPDGQQTVSIHIPTDVVLSDSRLQKALDAYYRDFASGFHEARRNAFYRSLFSHSLVMMHWLLVTHNNILFAPPEQQHLRRRYLSEYFSVVSVFVHDVALYRRGLDLASNPVDRSLDALLSDVSALHETMYVARDRASGSTETFEVAEDAVFRSLPRMSATFSEITSFFLKRFLL